MSYRDGNVARPLTSESFATKDTKIRCKAQDRQCGVCGEGICERCEQCVWSVEENALFVIQLRSNRSTDGPSVWFIIGWQPLDGWGCRRWWWWRPSEIKRVVNCYDAG